MFNRLLTPLLTTLYPQECHVCGGSVDELRSGVACEDCWKATFIFDGTETLCSKCGAHRKDGRFNAANRCGECEDAHYDMAAAAGVYERALAVTIVRLKREPYLPPIARDLLIGSVGRLDVHVDIIIIPVPLSRRRKFERGHNQAEVIGRIIADRLSLPMYSNALIRTGHSQIHRMGMDKKAREATVTNAFEAAAPRLIVGKNVLLVDDVLTSGSTASACAKVLKKNGASSVNVLTLARAVMYK